LAHDTLTVETKKSESIASNPKQYAKMKHKLTIHAERDGAFTRWSLRSGATKKAKRRRNKMIRKEKKTYEL
jgi:hypothetical protein